MTLYTCEFPLPPTACSPNFHPASRGGRMGKAAKVKAYRSECCSRAVIAKREGRLKECLPGETIIHLEYYCGRARTFDGHVIRDERCRPLDKDNAVAASKQIIDSLRDAGVLIADDHRHLSIGRVVLHRRAEEHGGRCCVEVTLEVVE